MRFTKPILAICIVAGMSACALRPPPIEIVVDDGISASVEELPGLSGGPPREVGVIVEPDGRRTEFVAEEVILLPNSEAQLNDFLAAYSGTVLRPGTPSERPYIIHVDLSAASRDDLPANLAPLGYEGTFSFSSESAARTVALVAREGPTIAVTLNQLLKPDSIDEHPDGSGGFIDWEIRRWMTEDDDPAVAGDQGLSIGVVRAWEFLEYSGIPTFAAKGSIAIVDQGFSLDPNSGFPQPDNPDYTRTTATRPLQVDLIDDDLTAGGMNTVPCGPGNPCPWHGTNVFGVAGAINSNEFGGAGTGGNFVSTIHFRMDYTFGMVADAIYEAFERFDVDVVNLSLSGNCGFGCDLSQFFGLGSGFGLQLAINHANNAGAIVVAAAGNAGINLGNAEIVPCELEPAICVGSINFAGGNLRNFGSSVDIWAPEGIRSTVTPLSAMGDADNEGIDEVNIFGGTSAATPFVSGVVAMMKALDPDLKTNEVIQILQDTANFNTADVNAGPRVTEGWVDAFRAVSAVSPNKAPTVQIIWPPDGELLLQGWVLSVLARATDPEVADAGGTFTNDGIFTEGGVEFCRDAGPLASCSLPPFSPGTHEITATVTDAFGATASHTIEFSVVNLPPVARIDFPKAPETTFAADQQVCFHGTGYDADPVIPAAVTLEWTDGGATLSTEPHFCTALAEGTHSVALTVTDSIGQTASDEVVVTITAPSGLPSTQIVSPDSFQSFGTGQTVTLVGFGSDPEDGTIPDANLVWHSDVDGILGVGPTISVNLTSPQDLGAFDGLLPHTIRLVATDSDGNEASTDQVVVLMGLIL